MNNANNAIIATIFVAMVMASGLVLGFAFTTPQDSLVYEKATGVGASDGTAGFIPLGARR
jgi:hypothetical protein